MHSAQAPAAGLSDTDAFLNIQQTGETFFAAGVAVPGGVASGQRLAFSGPLSFTVDLQGVAAGTLAMLSFDLLGFGPRTSIVMVDEVALSGALPPTLTLALDPESDTGVLGDGAGRKTGERDAPPTAPDITHHPRISPHSRRCRGVRRNRSSLQLSDNFGSLPGVK
jgi:hypothetical protein